MEAKVDILLQLIKVALGNDSSVDIPSNVDWDEVKEYAETQGVYCVAFDGLQNVFSDTTIDKYSIIDMECLMEWAGQTNRVELAYKRYTSALFSFVKGLVKHNIKVMVLKGYGCSLNYPIPNHRPCGDIDIFSTSYDEVNMVVEESGGEVNYDNDHHAVFHYADFSVENHQTVLDVNVHKSSVYLNELLESLARETFEKEQSDEIILPSVKFNSIHLLRHMASDFATVTTSLRHVLDWATFINSNTIDWDYIHDVAHKANMNKFLDAINGICIEYLGYPKEKFPVEHEDRNLRERVLNDILYNTDTADRPNGKMTIVEKTQYSIKKAKRFWRNRWKYQIVYKESLWESFCTLALNRLSH